MKYNWIMETTGATKSEVDHCIRFLKLSSMIETQKATRGFHLTILNYCLYQKTGNYRSDTEATQNRKCSDTESKMQRHRIEKEATQKGGLTNQNNYGSKNKNNNRGDTESKKRRHRIEKEATQNRKRGDTLLKEKNVTDKNVTDKNVKDIPSTPKDEFEGTHKKPNNHELIPYEKNKKSQSKEITKFVNDYINYISNTFDKLAPKQTKTLFDKSYDAVDKLIRIDKHSFKYVYDVILWSSRDEFWKDKIKSIAGLRKKNDDLTKFQKVATAFDKATHEYKPSQQLSNVGMRMMDKLQNY